MTDTEETNDAEEPTSPEPAEQTQEQTETEPDTFPRAYVQELRDENAKYRQRAQRADDLAARLHTALVAATGRLADPTELAYDETHLQDADALTAAIDDLLARKPNLATRRPTGEVGQGASVAVETVDLAGLLRARAV